MSNTAYYITDGLNETTPRHYQTTNIDITRKDCWENFSRKSNFKTTGSSGDKDSGHMDGSMSAEEVIIASYNNTKLVIYNINFVIFDYTIYCKNIYLFNLQYD